MKKWLVALIGISFGILWIPEAHSQSPSSDFRTIQNIEREPIPMVGGYRFREQFALSPDGSQIAAAYDDFIMRVWDIETGDIIYSFDISTTTIAWSPDGELIAAAARYDNVIGLWDSESGNLARNLFAGCSTNSSIAWSPDSSKIVTSCGDILDAQTSNLDAQLDLTWYGPDQVAWSPDGTMIATSAGYENQLIRLFSDDGTLIDTYWGDYVMAWSPDSTRLATTGQIRDIENGLPVTIIPELEYDVAWHPNGDWIASTSDDGDIHLWDVHMGDLVTSWHVDGCRISGFIWSASGERFAFSCIQFEHEFKTDLVIGELLR